MGSRFFLVPTREKSLRTVEMAAVERKEIDKSSLKGKPIVWIMGGPGSGRGTQCEMIHLKCGYKHISSGDLLRADVMSGSKRGQQLYRLMPEGQPVPNNVVDDLLAEAMVAAAEKSKGFLIDGYPADVTQAGEFESDIGAPSAIIYLEADPKVLTERLIGRGNFDDNKGSVEKRLASFEEKTKPVIAKYGDKVKTINVERSKDDIFADVLKVIEAI